MGDILSAYKQISSLQIHLNTEVGFPEEEYFLAGNIQDMA